MAHLCEVGRRSQHGTVICRCSINSCTCRRTFDGQEMSIHCTNRSRLLDECLTRFNKANNDGGRLGQPSETRLNASRPDQTRLTGGCCPIKFVTFLTLPKSACVRSLCAIYFLNFKDLRFKLYERTHRNSVNCESRNVHVLLR